MSKYQPLTMLLFGGDVHNHNRGVSALGVTSLANLRRVFPAARLVVADSGLATRLSVQLADETFEAETSWIVPSRVLCRRSSTRHLNVLRRLRPWIPRSVHRWISSRAFRQLQEADVVLDICGGDSFTKIYGQRRFQSQMDLKRLVLAMKKPLVLLPQTYGPFTSDQAVQDARCIVRGSLLAASRDLGGVEVMEQLVGPDIRPRLASCPDVAFTLEPVSVEPGEVPAVLRRRRDGLVIGLNVSGWLHTGHAHIPLSADYREVISAIVQWAMSVPDSRLLLVPHVFGPHRPDASPAHDMSFDSSDLEACRIVQQQWESRFGDRIGYVEQPMEAARLKYLIGQCDFFIGARMHSCIAAASQCVPTVALAYSHKAEGVFGMIGVGSMVVDMRQTTIKQVLERVKALYDQRDRLRHELRTQIPRAKEAVRAFFADRLREALIEGGIIKDSIRSNHDTGGVYSWASATSILDA